MATRSPLTRLLSMATGLLLVLTTVACDRATDAGVEDDPEGALRSALEELADYAGIELLLRLAADDDARAQALAEDELTEDELDLLLSSNVLVRATGQDDEDGAAEFVVTVDDTSVAELRILPDTELYLRVDLDAVLELVDDPEARQQVDEFADQAEAFGLRDVVEATQRGEWVRVTGLQQLMNLFGATPQPDEVEDEEQERMAEELSAAAIRFVDQDVTVSYVGSDDVGERVRATTDGASLQRFLEEVTEIAASSEALGGASPQDLGGELDEIPSDATVSLDAWISDGRLTQLAFDLTSLDEEGTMEGELLLIVGLAEFTGSIEAPDEATEVDLFGLIGGFMGGFGGGPSEGAFDDGSDGGFDDDAAGDEGLEDGTFTGECLTEDELEQMRTFLDDDEQAEFDEAVEAGIIPVC
jgi:hypothetical protein